jgi:hypothetical protein
MGLMESKSFIGKKAFYLIGNCHSIFNSFWGKGEYIKSSIGGRAAGIVFSRLN